MDSEYILLADNEKEFVDRMILDIRFGLRRTEKGWRALKYRCRISSYDMPRIMNAYKEQAAKLTDADLFPEDPMIKAICGDEVESLSYTRPCDITRAMRRDYDSMDDESALIAMINDSITAGLLSPEDLDDWERKRKTGDFLCKVAIIAICVIIFLVVVVFGVH